jgi:hypothetical protein
MQACPTPLVFCFVFVSALSKKKKGKNVEEKRKKLYDLTADMKQ